MADKNQYQKLLRSQIESAVSQARAASALTHAGVKGTILEILVGNLFKPLLPSDIGVGTGQIIDYYGPKLSKQIDIVLYDKSILPPILIDDKNGIFPIESALYTIEVKTTLTSSELQTSHASAKELAKEFGYLSGQKDKDGNEVHHNLEKLRSVVFALNSDLSGNNINEAERYKKIYGEDSPYIRAICVVGREYWHDNGRLWLNFQSDDPYDEVLGFIAGVTNTYKSVALSRGRPNLGNYVAPECVQVKGLESVKTATVEIACEKCDETAKFYPEFGKMNITINGRITSSIACQKCGGKMMSAKGIYEIKNGQLL